MRHLQALCLLALVSGITLAPRISQGCAGCRNPSMPVTRGSEGVLDEGALRVGAALSATAVHVTHEAGCRDTANCREIPVQPAYLHDQHLYPLELRLSAEYGVTKNLGLELQLPFRLIRTTIDYKTLDGAAYNPLDADIHHRNETIAGLADPWLLTRVGTTVQNWWVAVRLGVSVPLGRTEEDPFERGDRGLKHQHIQLGSGTFDPVGVAEASTELGAFRFQVFTQAQVPLYDNSHGYRGPWRIYGGTSLGAKLIHQLSGSLGIEAFHEAAETWGGEVRQDASLGRTELLAAGSVSQRIGATQLALAIRIPFFRHIVVGDEPPGTLESPLTLSLSVTHVTKLHRESGKLAACHACPAFGLHSP
jgi:hypothetical protein